MLGSRASPRTIIDPVEFEKDQLPKLCKRQGPDAFGFTGELVRAFFPNEVCKKGFCLIVELIANNALTTLEKAVSIDNTILPVKKASRSKNPIQPTVFNPQPIPPQFSVIDPELRIRSVTQNALAYKGAATNQLAQLDKEAVSKATGPHQLADAPGGAITAIMKLQSFVDAAQFAPLNAPAIMIGVDVKGAFPNSDRSLCLDTSLAEPSMRPAHNINLTAYSHSTLVVAVQNGKIQWVGVASGGLNQGETFASILFCLSIAPLYSAAVSANVGVDATAICDDLKLHGEAVATISAFDHFSDSINRSPSLQLNPTKHEALWPYLDRVPPDWLLQALNERRIPLYRGWMPVLGSVIGADHERMASWVSAQISLNAPMFHLITHPFLHPQVAIRSLKACIHSKPSHSIRGATPTDSAEASLLWDSFTTKAVSSILQLPPVLPPIAQYIISAPMGLGFAKFEATSIAAWLGAQALASKQTLSTFKHLTRRQKHNTNTMVEMRKSYSDLDHFGAAGPLSLLSPPSKFHALFATKPPSKLQRLVSASIAKALHTRIMDASPRHEALHIKQYSGPGRTAFLSAIPTRSELATTPPVFRAAARNLLCIPLEGTPARCGLCNLPTTSPLHYIDCHKTRSQERLYLHNCIRQLVERLTRHAGSARSPC